MSQVRNSELVRNLLPDFHKRSDLALNLAHSISFISGLQGLVAFWPSDIIDHSGSGLNLSRNGSIVTINYDNNIVPYVEYVRASSQYLLRADHAYLDITGAESYVSSGTVGLTMGGWWKVNSAGNTEHLMAKWDSAPNKSYMFYKDSVADDLSFICSADGTANSTLFNSAIVPPVDTWFYGVAWYNPSTEVIIYYALATDNDLTEASTVASIAASIHSSTTDFTIGTSAGLVNFLNGRTSMTFLVRGRLPEIYIKTIFDLTSPLFAAT